MLSHHKLYRPPIQSRVWWALPLSMVGPRPCRTPTTGITDPECELPVASSGCEQASLKISSSLEKESNALFALQTVSLWL